MRNLYKILMLALCFFAYAGQVSGQTTGDYRSTNATVTVALTTSTNWQIWDGSAWGAAVTSPSANFGTYPNMTVTIHASDTFDNVAAVTIPNGVTILHQGFTADPITSNTITLNGTWIHNTTSSAVRIVNAMPTIASTSTFIYRGSSTLVAATSFSGRTYGNLTIESTSGSYSISASGAAALTINGNFNIGTSGAGTVSADFTGYNGANANITVGGAMSIGTGSSFAWNLTTTNNNSLSIGGNFSIAGTFNFSPTMTGGTKAINFTNNTTLSGAGTLTIGADVDNINVNLGNTLTLSRNVVTNTGTTFTNNGTLICGTNTISGAGNFTLASGATLRTANTAGVSGCIAVSGTRTFTSGANYEFNGAAAQSTGFSGLTMNTPNNITISNTNATTGVTLDQNIPVSGTFAVNTNSILTCSTNIISGAGAFTLASGATLRTANTSGVMGSITTSGTNTYDAAANYEFNNSGANQSAGFPASVSTMNNLTINTGASNRVNLNRTITVNGVATLTQGDLNLAGNNIVLGASASIAENITNQHLIKDLTATTDTGVQGGYIEANNRTVDNTTGQIAGLGVFLRTGGGSYSDLLVRRYHYTANHGVGIRVVYNLSSPSIGANATTIGFRQPTAEENPRGLTLNRVYRWSAGTWTAINSVHPCSALGADICTVDPQSSFSAWTLGNDSNAQLPITLISFKGERVSSEVVKLTWTTAQEINNKGFEVEMSDDLVHFKSVVFVDGKGNSLLKNDYQVSITKTNDAYYRLKQIDFDGNFSYSAEVFVKGTTGNELNVYPNPNNGTFTITTNEIDGATQARLFDTKGIEVPLMFENNTLKVVNSVPEGVYFLHTTVANQRKVTKMIITR